MTEAPVQLALGTVQFGLAYGIAGRGEAVPEAEVRAIFERAAELGIRRLDTAAAYGDIEGRLARLTAGLPFEVVSKVAALPSGIESAAARRFVATSLQRSRDRLGELLHGILFHSGSDLSGQHGAMAWECAAAFGAREAIQVGVSLYDPGDLNSLRQAYPVTMAQVPGSALDQRLAHQPAFPDDVEITLRSLFLQGLLLMASRDGGRRLPMAAPALERWESWRRERALSPLVAALSVAKALPGVSYCVVGVDSLEHLEEIAAAWEIARPIAAADLHTDDPAVIDPRKWAVNA